MLATLAALAPIAAPPPPQFEPSESLTAALEDPQSLEIVDVDGDGHADLVLSSSPSTFAWLEATGSGQFGRLHPIDVHGSSLADARWGDVDGDGDADLVAFDTSSDTTSVLVLFNRGDGTFDPPVVAGTNSVAPYDLVLADWDRDGDDDIFVSAGGAILPGGYELTLIESSGGGQFAAPRDVASLTEFVFELIAGDVDGDGDPDLAVESMQGVSIYRNDGVLPFAGPVDLPQSTGNTASKPVSIDDVDGDGDADVLFLNGGLLRWSPNLGAGGFGPPEVVAQEVSVLTSVDARDFDGDGDLDISASLADATILYENLGASGFGPAQILAPALDCQTRAVASGDIDGDGRIDLVECCQSARVSLRRNSSAGGPPLFDGPVEVSSRAPAVTDLEAFDLDGDGRPDVVAVNDPGSTFAPARVVAAIGSSAYTLDLARAQIEPATSYSHAITGDIDADGDLDVLARLAAAGASDAVDVLENVGGQLVFSERLDLAAQGGYTVADVDGDGDDDVAYLLSGSPGRVFWLEQSASGLDTTPQSLTRIAENSSVVFSANLIFEDLDGDGTLDLLASTVEDDGRRGRVVFRRGLGGTSYGPRVVIRAPQPNEQLWFLDVADLDGNGTPDPVVAGFDAAPAFAWFPNLGGGQFGAERVIDAGAGRTSDVELADVDLDGDVDVVATRALTSPEGVVLWSNRGDGTFESPTAIVGDPDVDRMVAADFDGDGDTDLAVSTRAFEGLFLVPNETFGEIGDVECISLPNSTGAVATTTANGSTTVALGRVQLRSADMPINATGFYLASLTPDNVVMPPNSMGVLCLGGSIGRYVGPGQILSSGANGAFALDLDLNAIPQPTGFVSAMPGQTWRFQAWHRDAVGGQSTSNFTNGLAIQFQ